MLTHDFLAYYILVLNPVLTFVFQKDCLASFFEPQELSGIDECFCAHCQTLTPSKQVSGLCAVQNHNQVN